MIESMLSLEGRGGVGGGRLTRAFTEGDIRQNDSA